MSQGTLYVNTLPRGILPKALVKALNLDITVADADTSEEFAKYFPLKKVPAFVGPNGAKLTEVIAITYYCMYTAAFFFSPLTSLLVCYMMRNILNLTVIPV